MERQIKQLADKAKRLFNLPSLSLAVHHQGKDYFYQSGKNAMKEQVTKETIYPIGSASKAFVGTALMMLQERGHLNLSDLVVNYLPELSLYRRADMERLTIKDLLCHSSGIPRHDISLFTNPSINLEKNLENVAFLPPAWPIGERFGYQNHLYGVASLLIERVSGMPWGAYIEQELFEPLKMGGSYTKSQAYESQSSYQLPKIGIGPFNFSVSNMNLDGVGGAGSLSSSAADMLSWTKCQLGNGTFGGRYFFSPETAELLHGKQIEIRKGEMMDYDFPEITDTGYGLGWFNELYKGERLVHHGGSLTGFKSEVGFIKAKEFAFAILMNRDSTLATSALSYALCDLFLEKESTDWFGRFKKVAMERKKRQRGIYQIETRGGKRVRDNIYLGCYVHPAYGSFILNKQRGKVVVQLLGKNFPLRKLNEDHYLIDLPFMKRTFPCKFVYDGKGNVCQFNVKLEKELAQFIEFEKVIKEE